MSTLDLDMRSSRWKPKIMAKYVYNKVYHLDQLVNFGDEPPLCTEWRLKHVATTMVDEIIKEEADLGEIDYWLDVKKEIRFMFMLN